jgi:aldose 1-epimerase
MLTKSLFDNYEGKEVYLYELSNEYLKVGITNFGAGINYLKVLTAKGEKDICLGYKTIKDYVHSATHSGATIGRVGNRIRYGKFTLDGKEYSLSINDGVNHLHGGTIGFSERFFDVEAKDNLLVFSLTSDDGDQGYPGTLKLKVEYSLNGKSLNIKFSAVSDKDTLWNPTNHTYFNLGGEDSGNVLDTHLRINADSYTPCDGHTIPIGEIKSVHDTEYDFTTFKKLGDMIEKYGGYDDNYILNSNHAATAYSDKSGIKLDVYTDLPAMQFYSGNFVNGRGKSREYFPHDGFCLEPQYVPNAINMDGFDKPILKANEKKSYYINYKFDF